MIFRKYYIIKCVSSLLVHTLLNLSLLTQISAQAVSNSKDKITISAEATVEADGRTRIECILTNNSQFVLATVYPHTRSLGFKFTLSDFHGERLDFDPDWALRHSQPDKSTAYGRLEGRGMRHMNIHPGNKVSFLFHLEDAFGKSAANGSVLDVKWVNYYSQPGGTITIAESTGADGTIIPKHEAENHFPGVRTFSVSLPLPKKNESDQIPLADQEPPWQEPSAARQDAHIPKPLPGPATGNPPASVYYYWWALLLIPLLAIVRFIKRARK